MGSAGKGLAEIGSLPTTLIPEIVSHSKKRTRGGSFHGDRGFKKALGKKQYCRKIDGLMWDLNELDIVSLALSFTNEKKSGKEGKRMCVDWDVGPYSLGCYLLTLKREIYPEFESIPLAELLPS